MKLEDIKVGAVLLWTDPDGVLGTTEATVVRIDGDTVILEEGRQAIIEAGADELSPVRHDFDQQNEAADEARDATFNWSVPLAYIESTDTADGIELLRDGRVAAVISGATPAALALIKAAPRLLDTLKKIEIQLSIHEPGRLAADMHAVMLASALAAIAEVERLGP